MIISKHEASTSLREIAAVHQRSATLQNYQHFVPYMIIWGVVCLFANGLCDFYPAQAGLVWPVLSILGGGASFMLGARTKALRRAASGSSAHEAVTHQGWRTALTAVVLFGFFYATFAVLPATGNLQATAFISLFFMFAYMIHGAWAGLRVFLIGFIAAAAILYGYFALSTHQYLWIGVCAGGALIAGGLWVKKT